MTNEVSADISIESREARGDRTLSRVYARFLIVFVVLPPLIVLTLARDPR